jgi:hypothetical protein
MILKGDNAGMLDGFFDEDDIALYEHPGQFSNVESAIKYENTIKDPIAKEAWEKAFVAYWGKPPSEIVYTLPSDKEKAVSALGFRSLDEPKLVALLERYKSNPESEEFKIESNGGTMSIAKKTLLSFLADVPYDAVRDYQDSIIRVGTDITSGTFSQMIANEYAREHNMPFADVSQMIGDTINGKDNPSVNKLSASEKEAFNSLVARWSAGTDFITKAEADNIKDIDPEGYELLIKKGLGAYQLRQENIAQQFKPYFLGTRADGTSQYDAIKMDDAYNKNELSKNQIESFMGKGALDIIKTIANEVKNDQKYLESQSIDNLPENLQEDYRKGLSKDNLDEFQENYLNYIAEQQERYQKYQDAIDTLTESGYRKLLPDNLGNAPISTQIQAMQFVEGGVVVDYDIPTYLRDTKIKDYKKDYIVNPASIVVLENLFGGDKDAVKPVIDSAQKYLDFLSTAIKHLQDNKLSGSELQSFRVALLDSVGRVLTDEELLYPLEYKIKKSEEATGLVRDLDRVLSQDDPQKLKEFYNSLPQDIQEEVADKWSYDPTRYSAFAQVVNDYNEAIEKTPLAKWVKMPVYFTPVGMGLAATESVAGLVSPYTISDEAIVRQIDDNYKYLDSTDKLDTEVNDILAKALKEKDIKVDGENALQTYKNLDDYQKTEVIKEYTRNMLGLDPSVMDKIMTGAMVVATAIGFKGQVLNPIVSKIISKYGIKTPDFLKYLNKLGDLGSTALHVPITGLFIAGSIPTITNPKVALDDKAIAIIFDAMMLRGMGKGLIGVTKTGFKKVEIPTTEITPKSPMDASAKVIPAIETAVDKVMGISTEPTIKPSLTARIGANLYDGYYNTYNLIKGIKTIPQKYISAITNASLALERAIQKASAGMTKASLAVYEVPINLGKNIVKASTSVAEAMKTANIYMNKLPREVAEAYMSAIRQASELMGRASLYITKELPVEFSDALNSALSKVRDAMVRYGELMGEASRYVAQELPADLSRRIVEIQSEVENAISNIGSYVSE